MLFPERWPRSRAVRPPQITSPFAAFSFDLCVSGASIVTSAPGRDSPAGQVWEWSNEKLQAEVLVSQAKPQVPQGMNVEGCVAAIWRVRANQDLSVFSLACTHDRETSLGPGGPCSGQGLEAQEWHHGGKVLTLGTQSLEAMIAHRRRGGRFPARLMHMNLSDLAEEDWVAYLPNGFKVQPPSLRPLEVIQVQFVAAWAPESGDDVSTWFAVDLAPSEILGLD
jgi:hypothetical protein